MLSVMVNTSVMRISSGVQEKYSAPLNSVITGLCLLTLISLSFALNAAENIAENDTGKTTQETAEKSEDIFEFRTSDTNITLILGNEVEGVAPELLSLADQHLEIPMHGQKASLNVSVAAGIALYSL